VVSEFRKASPEVAFIVVGQKAALLSEVRLRSTRRALIGKGKDVALVGIAEAQTGHSRCHHRSF
jgi:hypothetical protein